MRLPGWKPGGELVEVAEAGRDAGDLGARLVERVIRSKLSFSRSSMWLNSLETRVWDELEDHLLGPVDEVGRLARAVQAEPRDLVAGADQPAQRRHLADDARVVGGVRRRRDECRQLVDARPAAGVLELAALLELVDERDRVDRLALRVEREGGAVDLRVALAVEVGC